MKISKTLSALLVAGALLSNGLASFAATAPATGCYGKCIKVLKIGDTDMNGTISSTDASLLESYIINSQGINFIQQITSDVNGDSAITMADVDLIKKYVAKSITNFPVGLTYTIYLGDLTGDRLVTTADSTLFSNSLAGKAILTYKQKAAADVNGDRVVDKYDLDLINKYIAKQISHFPAHDTNGTNAQ
jgi:hypothetical protein